LLTRSHGAATTRLLLLYSTPSQAEAKERADSGQRGRRQQATLLSGPSAQHQDSGQRGRRGKGESRQWTEREEDGNREGKDEGGDERERGESGGERSEGQEGEGGEEHAGRIDRHDRRGEERETRERERKSAR
jgi:hypothetical protein